MAPIRGVHLVGSTGFSSTTESLTKCSASLPNLLSRLPDGETGPRHYFTVWQAAFFSPVPDMMAEFEDNVPVASKDFSDAQVAEGARKLREARTGKDGRVGGTGYDDAAVESYAVFKRLRDEGVVPKDVKFQVCLPTTPSVLAAFVQRDFRPAVEPIYEEALFTALQNIQASIPHGDLSIQIDLAADTAFWEDVIYPPWFHPEHDAASMGKRKAYMLDYTVRFFNQVASDVELGIHNCYGDMAHQHFVEPASLAVIAERGGGLFSHPDLKHTIHYFHLPVPLSAMDKLAAYYQPLKPLLPKMKELGTEFILGLVHAGDLEGTRERIRVARQVLGEDVEFAVATECGWGRTPKEDVESIFEISRAVAGG